MSTVCKICNGTIESLPLVCLKCKGTFHDTCVKRNDNLLSWTCSACGGEYLNPPYAPKAFRTRSVTSKISSHPPKSTSSSAKRAEIQIRLIEEEEKLLQQQSNEKRQMIAEQIRQVEEKEKCQQQLIQHMEEQHEKQKQLLNKKSMILESMCGSQRGGDSEAASIGGSEAAYAASKKKVEDWKTTFEEDIRNGVNKESTTIHQQRQHVTSLPVMNQTHSEVRATQSEPAFGFIAPTTAHAHPTKPVVFNQAQAGFGVETAIPQQRYQHADPIVGFTAPATTNPTNPPVVNQTGFEMRTIIPQQKHQSPEPISGLSAPTSAHPSNLPRDTNTGFEAQATIPQKTQQHPKPSVGFYAPSTSHPTKPNTFNQTDLENQQAYQLPRPTCGLTTSAQPTQLATDSDMNQTHRIWSSSYFSSKDTHDLPKFDGKANHWPAFYSKFLNTSPKFTADVNLDRLQNCLKGAARMAVEDLLYMPDNVPIIIETLKSFFGRPEYIVNALLDNVRRETKPKADDFDAIISFALQVRNICSTIVAARLTDHLWNPMLLQDLTGKLPAQYMNEWAELKGSMTSPNLEVFSNWLYSKALKLTSILTKPPSLNFKSNAKVNVHQHVDEDTPKRICILCSDECKSLTECEDFRSQEHEQRWDTVKRLNLCRCCLRQHSGKCRFSKPCGKDGCTYKHNSLLHNPKSNQDENEKRPLNSHNSPEATVLFKILPITLYGKKKLVKTFALLDDGSSVTLMENDLAKELDIKDAIADPLCLQWTSKEVRDEVGSLRFDTQISAENGSKKFQLSNVRTVDKLFLPNQTLDAELLKENYPYLKNAPIVSYKNANPKLLIGLNNPLLMLCMKSKSGGRADPIASKTSLGWVVYGGGEQKISSVFHMCECKLSMERELSAIVKQYIAMDNLNVSPLQKELLSEADERSVRLLENNLKFNGSRYECGLLWSHEDVKLPDSYVMAYNRLQCLERKFTRQPHLKLTIESQINSYLQKGYIRELTEKEIEDVGSKCWYLPIFAVSNPNKPQKVRIVWDAAAKAHGCSLNSVLLKGPDFLVSLPGVLMRFRERRFAITGDIREMFHQIQVKEDDQHFQRFLFRTDTNKKPKVFMMMVMTFGASCSPAIAQYAKNQNAARFENSFPQASKAIMQNHYVDDWLESVDGEDEAIRLAEQVKNIHQAGGFIMGSWISNSRRVMNALGNHEDLKKNLDLSSETLTEKVLGMWWCVSEDVFSYSLRFNKGDADVLQGKRIPTKRQLLRIIMSVYDPLGLLAHFMAYAKILLQFVWRNGTKWDDDVPEELLPFWYEWVNKLPEIENVKIPRFYFQDHTFNKDNIELHIFVDGSEEGYAAVGYLRITDGENIQCRIIAAKSRVAPLKHHSIPRLELLAAVLGVRLAITIQKEHSIQFKKRYLWSDSKTVCSWIKSQHKRYKQFVACRVGEILESSDPDEWRWIQSSKNIADSATRMRLVDLDDNSAWFCGPPFLHNNDYQRDEVIEEHNSTDEELRPHLVYHLNFHRVEIPLERFSSWTKLQRTNAYICRYKNNLKAKSKGQPLSFGPLTSSELQEAECLILRQAQEEVFADEIAELRNSSPPRVSKKSKIYKLLPYLDNFGMLRRKGRLDEADFLTNDTKRQIILPHQHRVTILLLEWYHEKYRHKNHETVVNEMRQRFHYPQMRRELRRICKQHCQKCKNDHAQPETPVMANIPACRLQPFSRPFTFVGIDYFGPISVCIGRRREKRWGFLVTCLTFRAIHLESVHTLTTSSCILALRNFMNRRGQPREIYSDNATTFKGACKELKEVVSSLDEDRLATEFNNITTNWKFIPPTAAHMGGAWERLIGYVKKNLYYITNLRNIQDELFRSMLIEVENVVNSRPLTYVPIDSEDSEALTPNHFLIGSSSGHKPLVPFDASGPHLRESWHITQQLTNTFYKRFVKNIMPDLNRRTKWFDEAPEMKVGDVVLVLDDNIPKYRFPKGRVVNVHPGRDGKIRSATIRTEKGFYDRPVTKLAILDVRRTSEGVGMEPQTTFTGGSVTAAQH